MFGPDEFNRRLLEAQKQHGRIGVLKFWNTCCEQCSVNSPVAILSSSLTDEQLMAAHGRSCEMTAKLLSRMLPEDHPLLLRVQQIIPEYQLDAATVDYSTKLISLYNTLAPLDTGSVIYLISNGQTIYKVVLQAVVFAM